MFWRKKEPEDYIAKKDYKKAISMYRERLEDQPSNTALRINIADTLLLDRQVEAAIREYKKVAESFTETGYIVKAIGMYKKILKIRPDTPEIENLLHNLSERASVQETPVSTPSVADKKTGLTQELEMRLLKGLKPEEIRHIATKLELRHFEKDAVVVKEGEPGDSLFIVVRGEVRVITKDTPNKQEVFLANLGEGEFFGEIALLTGKPRTATIMTNEASELLELKRQNYEEIIAKYPTVRKVVEDFHLQRASKTVEALIQALHSKS